MDRDSDRVPGYATREGVMDETKPKLKDQVLVLGKNDDGDMLISRRKPNGRVTVGEATPIKEGKPLPQSGEIVYLKERAPGCPMYDVEDSFDLSKEEQSEDSSSGPAMVASPAFRSNWDSIFGGDSEQLN